MRDTGYYPKLFLVAAIYNWAATIPFFFAHKAIFGWLGMEPINYPVILRLFLALAFVFGIGYYWVSRDVRKNRDLIRTGILGKLFVFILFFIAWITGEIPFLLMLPGVGDLIFAILFIGSLRQG
jgi:hypothetical protein